MELMSEYRTCLQGTDGLKRWTSDAGDTPAPLIFYIIFIFFKNHKAEGVSWTKTPSSLKSLCSLLKSYRRQSLDV